MANPYFESPAGCSSPVTMTNAADSFNHILLCLAIASFACVSCMACDAACLQPNFITIGHTAWHLKHWSLCCMALFDCMALCDSRKGNPLCYKWLLIPPATTSISPVT
eukprot:GHUV01049656.1.p1 GENE.GHUV01049656.1~~GHUV01049656.1.p1  ORF type:complete len:108 (+),score=16.47 GHUV01049656.1:385-708(+)